MKLDDDPSGGRQLLQMVTAGRYVGQMISACSGLVGGGLRADSKRMNEQLLCVPACVVCGGQYRF